MKILIIEDDLFVRTFFSTKLAEDGYQVEVGVDGEDGMIKATTFKPDLILLDIIMPKKDGFQVLEELAKSDLRSIPVIIMSTLGQESDQEKAIKLGARDYINKSFFDYALLKNKILKQIPLPTNQ